MLIEIADVNGGTKFDFTGICWNALAVALDIALPDPAPVVLGDGPRLEQVGVGLNAPFRERPGREEPADWSWLRRPVVWGTLAVLVAVFRSPRRDLRPMAVLSFLGIVAQAPGYLGISLLELPMAA